MIFASVILIVCMVSGPIGWVVGFFLVALQVWDHFPEPSKPAAAKPVKCDNLQTNRVIQDVLHFLNTSNQCYSIYVSPERVDICLLNAYNEMDRDGNAFHYNICVQSYKFMDYYYPNLTMPQAKQVAEYILSKLSYRSSVCVRPWYRNETWQLEDHRWELVNTEYSFSPKLVKGLFRYTEDKNAKPVAYIIESRHDGHITNQW